MKEVRRMRILGSDTVAGDPFRVRASGLAECQYGKHFRYMEMQARCVIRQPGGTLIWEGAREARPKSYARNKKMKP